MNRDFAGKAHPRALDTIAAAPVGILDVNENGVDRLDLGRSRGEQRHDSRVTKYFEELATLVAIAPRANCRRKILGAPRHAVDARMHSQVFDVEQTPRSLGREQQQLDAPLRIAVLLFESAQDRIYFLYVSEAPHLRNHVGIR